MNLPPPFKELHFGTSGIPPEVGARGYFTAVKFLNRKRLTAMEMEFVQQVHMDEETAIEFGKLAKTLKIHLSSHAPYYVNLASMEKEKLYASINRIVKAGFITACAGGHSVVFHAGFYQGRSRDEVYTLVARGIQKIEAEFRKREVAIWLRPEITGKETQFGNLKELIRLANEFEYVLPCIDFSHLHARSVGKFNTREEWADVLEHLRDETAKEKEILKRMHIHISGIEYGKKGERRHLPLEKADLDVISLLRVLKEYGVCGTVICEAPAQTLVSDTLKLKRFYSGNKDRVNLGNS